METKVRRDDELEIDLLDLLSYLLGKIGYILGLGIVFGVIAMVYTMFFVTPKYTSTTKMYVLNRQASDTITNSDLQSSTYLTKDYIELIKSRAVIEAVIANLDLGMSYERVLGETNVSVQSDTRIVTISVTDADPYLARDMANEIRTTAATHIQDVMNIEAVNVVDVANTPTSKSSPSLRRNVMMAAAIGALLMIAWFVIRYLMNDKIFTSEDVEHYLGLPVLCEMPYEDDKDKKSKRKKKSKA